MNKTICLDIGHCESTASYPEERTRYVVRKLALDGEKNNYLSTQIILTDKQIKALQGFPKVGRDGPSFEELKEMDEFKIGNLEAGDNEKKFYYFKAAPKDFCKPCDNGSGITHGTLMACFAFQLVNNILLANDDYFPPDEQSSADRSNMDLLVGCPSTEDWTGEGEQEKYAALIKNATGVGNVHIVPESRAAMFSNVGKNNEAISPRNGALVFDFGSSTADATYMLLGRKLLESSWTLGASEIELKMTKYCLGQVRLGKTGVENTTDSQANTGDPNFEATINSYAEVVNQTRDAKQSYYSSSNPSSYEKTIVCTFVDAKTSEKKMYNLTINKKFMDEITGKDITGKDITGEEITDEEITDIAKMSVYPDSSANSKTGSWKTLCKQFFEDIKGQIEVEHSCPIDTIVLTGGASRMYFIEEICRKVFSDVDPKKIIKGANPSFTVSTGLGWVAVSDANLPECRDAVFNELNLKENCRLDAQLKKISNALFPKIKSIILSETQKWADEIVGDTVENLLKNIQVHIKFKSVQADFRTTAQSAVDADEIEKWKANLTTAIEPAVNSQAKKLYSDEIYKGLVQVGDIKGALQVGNIDTNKLSLNELLQKMDLGYVAIQGISRFGFEVVALFPGIVSEILDEIFNFIFSDYENKVSKAYDSAYNKWLNMLHSKTHKQVELNKPYSQQERARVLDILKNKLEKDEEKDKMMEKIYADLKASVDAVIKETISNAFEVIMMKRFDVYETKQESEAEEA